MGNLCLFDYFFDENFATNDEDFVLRKSIENNILDIVQNRSSPFNPNSPFAFGIPDVTAKSWTDPAERRSMENAILKAVTKYENRLSSVSVKSVESKNNAQLVFLISGNYRQSGKIQRFDFCVNL